MRIILALFFTFFLITSAEAATYYVRTDGGTTTQCTGTTDAAYPGSGTGQACAFSHPFYATDWCGDYPSNCGHVTPVAGGSTIVVVSGSYDMGYDASWTDCNSSWKYGCNSKPIPDGSSGTHTKLIGCTTTGCASTDSSTWPVLYIAEGEKFTVNLQNSDYVDVSYLRLTETRTCGRGHSTMNCTNPDNDGIDVTGSTNIGLSYLLIDGFSRYAIFGGPVTNITFSHVDILGNSFGGVITDTTGSCSTCGWSGVNTFSYTTIKYSGCIEDGSTQGLFSANSCYSQDQNGYGDGLGAAKTDGTWVLDHVDFSHNVSDGLDLLYCNNSPYSGCVVTINKSRFEGNAGNNIKVPNNTYIEDTENLANCGYFYGQSFTCSSGVCGANFNHCRASGNAYHFQFASGDNHDPVIVNNTGVANSDVFILTKGVCSGRSVKMYNSVARGGREFLDDSSIYGGGGNDSTSIIYKDQTDGVCLPTFTETDNICYGFKEGASACTGARDVVSDPLFSGTIALGPTTYYSGSDLAQQIYIQAGSPAVGVSDETVSGANSLDYNDFDRGAVWDAGALEYGSTGGGGGGSSPSAHSSISGNFRINGGKIQ